MQRNSERPIMVSLWAGPGTGKSSTAALIFNILKYHGYRVELSWEFAKDITYEQNWKAFQDQFYISACQERRNSRLIGEVDIILTDSPPGLGLVYAPIGDVGLLTHLVVHWRRRYRNMDYRLLRDPTKVYQQFGRTQTKEEAERLDGDILGHMNRVCEDHTDVQVQGVDAAMTIAEDIMGSIKNVSV